MKRIWAFFITTVMMMAMVALPVRAVTPVNLITNGNFEAGDSGFTSGYTPVTAIYQNSLQPPLVYAIGTNPNSYHSAWATFGDHTSGTGKMMIVNGTTVTPPAVVWGQDVTGLPQNTESATQEFPLYAGQNELVGDILVKSNGTQICVKFILSSGAIDDGWYITETHFAIADDEATIPNSNGNPTPGKFPAGEKSIHVSEAGWYCLNIGAGWTAPYAVATHAVVERVLTDGYHVSSCAISGAGTDSVTYLSEDSLNPGYPVGYSTEGTGTYPDGIPSVLAWVHSAWLPYGIDGAQWISSAEYAEAPDYNTWRLFRRNLIIPLDAVNITAHLTMNADNAEVAFVNDIRIGDGDPAIVYGPSIQSVTPPTGEGRHGYDSVEDFPVPNLGTGTNRLWIMTRNYAWAGGSMANPTALIYKLCYEYDVLPVMQKETAWGGTSDFSGKNWANYISYTPTAPESFTYTLKFFAKSSYVDPAPGQLEVQINGVVIPPQLNLGSVTNGWSEYTAVWTAGTATHADIKIRDLRIAYTGNDFCIDDISFVKN